jgi:diguanylate cyclase (GGDEF)-like protein/PAS domain S-box-containing protein
VTRSATAARASPAQDGELRVLILEDMPADAELIARALEQAGINALVKVVDTRESFAEQLSESPPDLILADYSLPGFDGEQALEIARTIAPEVPFIFVTGTLGEEHAVELMKQGAWDYVTKEHLSRLGLAVRRALKEVADSRDREELRQRERAAMTALRESEERFRALVQNSADVIITVDEDGIATYGSPAAKSILGIDPVDALGSNVFDLVHPDDRDRAVATFRETLQLPGTRASLCFRARRADGIYVDLEAVSNNLLDDPAVRAVVINARDVTERRRAERLLKSEALLLDDIAGGARLEHSLKEIAREMEGYVSDWPCLIILSGEPIPSFTTGNRLPAKVSRDMSRLAVGAGGCPWLESGPGDDRLIGSLESDPAWPPAEMLTTRYGLRAFWGVPIRGSALSGSIGAVLFLSGVNPQPTPHDVEVARLGARLAAIGFERRQVQAQITHNALHDALTDLPNRTLLLERTAHAVARSRRSGTLIALLMVDIDHFKYINDSLGHSVGDQVLIEIGKRFCTVVRPDDTVARLGGDEFVVLSDGLPNEAQVMRYAQRILNTLVPPMHVDGHEVRVGASVGIAIDGNILEPEVFFRDADAAMYHAKENGRGRIEIFDTKMRNLAITRLETEDRLHRAVDEGLIRPHYQPIVEIGSQRVVGAEALARWNDPEMGEIPPTVFVPIAEDSGLIVPLGAQILTSACATAAQWPSTLQVNVNLSGCQIRDPGLVDTIETALREANLDPGRLLLEITESVYMKDVAASTDVLRRLHELGVRLAIDDFGTAYSSLGRLKRFPIAQLKIDRSFVDGLPEDADDLAIVTAVITMGHSLGIKVLAEGIETEAQLTALQSLGCDLGQGFLLSHALPEAEFTSWLCEHDSRATSSPARATKSASLKLVG